VPNDHRPLLVTGANGHLGVGVLRRASPRPVRAVVRSERAAAALRESVSTAAVELQRVDLADEGALARAAAGCGAWIHLVGILKESSRARYAEAHEELAARVARAAEKAGIARIVYPSILGASPDSTNACLSSKGRAEQILLQGAVPATVLRLPMVLGPGELAAQALAGKARAPILALIGGGLTLEQPIDARDAASAVLLAADDPGSEALALDLAGPEPLAHRELVGRVATLLGLPRPRILPIPRAAAELVAGLMERVAGDPPITRAMLGVLEHDDAIDPAAAARRLGLVLTSLAETLRHTFIDGDPSHE
jgi:NADH dehydrogenase